MPVIVGLLLIPVGAMVATCIFLGLTIAQYATTFELATLLRVSLEMIPYGLLYGSQFFLPVALLVLPLAHLILRRYARLSIVALVATGLLTSILLMWGIILFEKLGGNDIPFLSRRTLNFSFIGGTAGAVVGLAFVTIIRWWRPFEWRGYWSTLRAGPAQGRATRSRLQPGGGGRR